MNENTATLIEDARRSGDFRVEYIDEDGGIEVAVFAGPQAKERAIHFAATYYPNWSDPQAWGGY